MNYKLLTIVLLLISAPHLIDAQCTLNATLEGDPILCPNETSTLQTQDFDSYQWYRIPWGGGPAELIPGATNSSIVVSEADILYTYFVEVTQDTCTDHSDSLLIDGWVFLLPAVSHSGEYTFNPNTEQFEVCEGDTMFLELLQPYEVNITWYKDGAPIAGENTTLLAITQTGSYTVEGAPAICPNYIQPLGLDISVLSKDCSTSIEPISPNLALSIYPNPAVDHFQVTMPMAAGSGRFVLSNNLGQVLWESGQVEENSSYTFYPKITVPGTYWLLWNGNDGCLASTMVRFQSGQ